MSCYKTNKMKILSEVNFACDVIKQNESEFANIDFEK